MSTDPPHGVLWKGFVFWFSLLSTFVSASSLISLLLRFLDVGLVAVLAEYIRFYRGIIDLVSDQIQILLGVHISPLTIQICLIYLPFFLVCLRSKLHEFQLFPKRVKLSGVPIIIRDVVFLFQIIQSIRRHRPYRKLSVDMIKDMKEKGFVFTSNKGEVLTEDEEAQLVVDITAKALFSVVFWPVAWFTYLQLVAICLSTIVFFALNSLLSIVNI